jgi:hypothetical protein
MQSSNFIFFTRYSIFTINFVPAYTECSDNDRAGFWRRLPQLIRMHLYQVEVAQGPSAVTDRSAWVRVPYSLRWIHTRSTKGILQICTWKSLVTEPRLDLGAGNVPCLRSLSDILWCTLVGLNTENMGWTDSSNNSSNMMLVTLCGAFFMVPHTGARLFGLGGLKCTRFCYSHSLVTWWGVSRNCPTSHHDFVDSKLKVTKNVYLSWAPHYRPQPAVWLLTCRQLLNFVTNASCNTKWERVPILTVSDYSTSYSSEISPTRCYNCVFILRNGFTLHLSGDNLTHHLEYICCIWPQVSRLT